LRKEEESQRKQKEKKVDMTERRKNIRKLDKEQTEEYFGNRRGSRFEIKKSD
jgi:hypothetical protein